MKIYKFLDGIIFCCLIIFTLILVTKTVFNFSHNYLLSAIFLAILVLLIMLAYKYNLKISKKTGNQLYDLSMRKKFGGYKTSTSALLLLRIIVLIVLLTALIVLLTSEILDNTPILTVFYINMLTNLNTHILKYAIYQNGIACGGRFYGWPDISGIIQYSGNSLELRVKGLTTPLTLYYDIKQRDEIAEFLKNKFNDNLFIDKKS